MERGEVLATVAQIAVALVGFAGVVVAFRSSSLHEWSLVDKFRRWLLLGSALVPLFSCLFGMLLLAIKPTLLSIWRWCSGCALVLTSVFGFLSRRRQSELGPAVIKEMGTYRYVFYMIDIVGTGIGRTQLHPVPLKLACCPRSLTVSLAAVYVRTKVRCTSSAGARTRSGNQLPTPFETISLLAPLL